MNNSFLAEMKRRNVFRVGTGYAVVAWLLLQAADILLGNFGAPDWVFKSLTIIIPLGGIYNMWLATTLAMPGESQAAAEPLRRARDAGVFSVLHEYDLALDDGRRTDAARIMRHWANNPTTWDPGLPPNFMLLNFWWPRYSGMPEFLEFAAGVGLVDYWEEFGYPDFCVRLDESPPRLECTL